MAKSRKISCFKSFLPEPHCSIHGTEQRLFPAEYSGRQDTAGERQLLGDTYEDGLCPKPGAVGQNNLIQISIHNLLNSSSEWYLSWYISTIIDYDIGLWMTSKVNNSHEAAAALWILWMFNRSLNLWPFWWPTLSEYGIPTSIGFLPQPCANSTLSSSFKAGVRWPSRKLVMCVWDNSPADMWAAAVKQRGCACMYVFVCVWVCLYERERPIGSVILCVGVYVYWTCFFFLV